ncbi:lytic transglycosylase [Streptomyces pathocidini]|uniref:Lytic transglycosylase n=1 Tax=Streptomyces pathocidini TaxID=1650571 RepID=A0ABW7UY07_9ACTN|nr:lytic transglycosylase domain-containing protein [Streptomyces pathocidini]
MAAQFGRRLRKGAATTAVAAVAMAALSASQAPEELRSQRPASDKSSAPAADTPIDGGGSYYTDLPPLNTPGKPGTSTKLPGGSGAKGPAEAGIPATVLDAYKKAESSLAQSHPQCRLPWELLAAIGKVESGQASGGRVDAEGNTLQPILGPQLNGQGFADITDTDGGAYDGDTTHDRAVGPMQFIPSTWQTWRADGNGDGERNPNNIYDAALAAGRYLCAGNRDLSVQGDLERAILGYNHSQEYLRTVLSWLEYYRKGTHEVPDGTGVIPVNSSNGSGGSKTGGATTPSGSPSPTPSGTGAGPGSGSGSGSGSGKNPSADPSEPGATPSGTPPGSDQSGAQTPAERAGALSADGSREFTATAGGEFAESPRVLVKDKAGAPVAKVAVRYEISGTTGARFPGGATTATVATGSDGTAAAPKLTAGEKTGDFTVRATVVGRALAAVDFTATVKPRPAPQADAIARTGDTPLKAETGGEFAEPVEIKATNGGQAASGVAVTATMVKSADDATQNDKGPYFKDASGNPIRTLGTLETGADGTLKLPKIYADGQAGTFLLRLTTAGGGTLTIELTVTDPAPQPSPSAT